MDSQNIRASPNMASLIRAGKILTTQFSTVMAPLPKDLSPCVKYRVTCMRQRPPPESLQKFSATLDDRESCQNKRNRSLAGSTKPFGATTYPHTPLRWTGGNSLAGCER